MKNTTKKKSIKEILQERYKNQLTDVVLDKFAEDIYHSLFVGQYDLTDIIAIICGYGNRENIDIGDVDCLFGEFINLLDNNESTARRLYNCFMEDFENFDVCIKLLSENVDFLSVEELTKAKKHAFEIFDNQYLEDYGIAE